LNNIKPTIKEQNIIFIVCAIVILYQVYKSSKYESYLQSEYKYTIGKTIKYEFNDGTKDCVQFKYYVNGKKIINCEIINPNICCPLNKFYRVKYSKVKPEICELFFSKEVKDSSEIIKAGLDYDKEE